MKKLQIEKQDLNAYLESSDIIDYQNKIIQQTIRSIASDCKNEIDIVKKIFEFVRDKISHSSDIKGEIVTYKASDVLLNKQGICYAKSHLLASLLRALNIPCGFCYQKLILDDEEESQLIIHGLNAVYLKTLKKWIRLDARGNKKGVDAQFSLDKEKLAFHIREELGEQDIMVVYAKPSSKVIKALKENSNIEELENNLPSEL